MVSLRSLLAATALVVGIQADYWIDPSSVPLGTRNAWCTSQKQICPSICLDTAPGSGKPISNDCYTDTLLYSCVCGNGITPNVSEYSMTLPYYTCQQYQANCVTACGASSNNECSAKCYTEHPCGAQNPTHANTSTTTTGPAAATSTGPSSPTLEPNFDGSTPGSGSAGTHLQASLTLATLLTGLLAAPFLII